MTFSSVILLFSQRFVISLAFRFFLTRLPEETDAFM